MKRGGFSDRRKAWMSSMSLLGHALLIAWSVTLLPQASSPPFRVGPTADHLTADDMVQMARLAEEAGGQVWGVVARQLPLNPPGRQMWFADVYFVPDQSRGRVRRGRALTVTTQIPSRDNFGGSRTWTRPSLVEPLFDWAQVREAERDPDQVTHSRDRQRPFRVSGQIEDQALSGAITAVQARDMWPVVVVIATGDDLMMDLRTGPNEGGGQRVLARPWNGQWDLSLAGLFTHAE
jgi:hypothetical protein